ncbi:Acg family FMN-binding oxidoreductase [Streptomyces roseicoloratus]|uniref:Nitroreductase family protein n=1 Tax=Streptomyces roseicoloratus TaxID=2508722 RepID=A0ABY9RRB0_9ACTN|nr:nitroreductase family protein [Streptomyces roseicoloratus]WMX44011.1 nitroreductase family protein [Streptomyces roseicoloratus]
MSPTALTRPLVTSLVEDAVTAPSMHNAQPWSFRCEEDAGVVELHGDPRRALPREDPEHRALHLGCGAALLGLRVAAVHRGLRPVVAPLPSPDDPWHLADVRFDGPEGADGDLEPLHAALARRHTSRFPFTEERVPTEVMDGLRAAALLEGCRLVVPGPWHTDTVMGLVHASELFEAADEAVRAEIAAWTRTGAAGEGPDTEGIPSYAFGPRQYDVTSPVRDFGAAGQASGRGSARFERSPQIALLGTAGDTPEEWLRAGQAMQRVLLQATLDGLATSLMSQPLEWPELRSDARDPGSSVGFVHMVFRLGYGPPGRATPRRPVSEVLTFG